MSVIVGKKINNSNYSYNFDINQLDKTIFKICTACLEVAHDYAYTYCVCGKTYKYVDVSVNNALSAHIKKIVNEKSN